MLSVIRESVNHEKPNYGDEEEGEDGKEKE